MKVRDGISNKYKALKISFNRKAYLPIVMMELVWYGIGRTQQAG
jgi:hypothetical protein